MNPSFIEIYDNALNSDTCLQIIQKFETSDKIQRGKTGHGLDLAKKDSYDIQITGLPEWNALENFIHRLTFSYLKQYFRKYLYALLGTLSPAVIDPTTNKPTTINPENFALFEADYFDDLIRHIYRPDYIKIQKYLKNTGGFHHWHSEIYPDPHSPAEETLHRVLYFQYYLNTVLEGGETEFYYQNLKIKPQQGRLVIAPAGFTHTHKGHVPLHQDKYIITSWILFQNAEKMYGRKR